MATTNHFVGVQLPRRISGMVDMSPTESKRHSLFEYIAYALAIGAGVIFLVGVLRNNFSYFYVAISASIIGSALLVQLHRMRCRQESRS